LLALASIPSAYLWDIGLLRNTQEIHTSWEQKNISTEGLNGPVKLGSRCGSIYTVCTPEAPIIKKPYSDLLPGAPLSQNGFDNSGQRTSIPEWTSGDTASFTNNVIAQIAEKYAVPAYQDVVVAIQLLNEPLLSNLPSDRSATEQYYRDGFNNVRKISNTPVVFSDGFAPVQSWNGFLTPSDNNAQNVVVDHHEYQIFNNDFAAMSPAQHRQFVCDNVTSYTQNRDKWLVVGEWTAAMTDCAAALNGYGIGARYDGTFAGSTFRGSCENVNFIETWSQQFKDDMRQYVEAQLDVFELYSQGWIFWNFKTEASPEWDMFRLLDLGVFPQPLSDRRFGKACAF
jgi:glucan 1,3-beta-glucosidase